MRFLTAPLIFSGKQDPILNGIIVVNNDLSIKEVLDPQKNEISESIPIEKFPGLLCPSFINTHCHLELSHLKGKLNQKQKLTGFISELLEKRNAPAEEINQTIKDADTEMYHAGIAAVGDIANSADTIEIKKKSKIYYHTFIELFDLSRGNADEVFEKGKNLRKKFTDENLRASIVPHAPYTVSMQLLKMIVDEATTSDEILCIHNQETPSENEMFEKGTGDLINNLKLLTGAFVDWQSSGKSSMATIIEQFQQKQTLQLVHNTFTKMEDVHLAEKRIEKLFWCLCVRANLFIEDALPDVNMLNRLGCMITIGTDSYASNTSLSILDEIKIISRNFPDIPLKDLLNWATNNGALFLGIDSKFGSLDRGKSPGINHITEIDMGSFKLTENSVVQKIV